MRFLETGDFGLLENDLERVILRAYPELESWKKFFGERGAILSQVSGSGSAVYGLFADVESALEARRKAPRNACRPARGDLAAGGLLGTARCWGVAKR